MSIPPASSAAAGTLESNDIHVVISRSGPEGKTDISLESTVLKHFGPAILGVIESCLKSSGLTDVQVWATDKGALDCTIRARMETAIQRYKELAS